MDPPSAKAYKNMEVPDAAQDIWVSQLDSYENTVVRAEADAERQHYGIYFILLGPTDSGKSSFIEAVASKSSRKPLGIAKDQLESVTQEPCVYEVKNLIRLVGQKVYIIDTPGFADPRISELQVIKRIKSWRDMGHSVGGVRVLYFHPITDIRMPASRKRCLDIIQNFWGIRECASVMLVTSMWDRLKRYIRRPSSPRLHPNHILNIAVSNIPITDEPLKDGKSEDRARHQGAQAKNQRAAGQYRIP